MCIANFLGEVFKDFETKHPTLPLKKFWIPTTLFSVISVTKKRVFMASETRFRVPPAT